MPHGDLAFAVAVAGFAQKLRGDDLLGDWGYADVKRLAGMQWGFSQQAQWRSEFLRTVDLADSRTRTASAERGEKIGRSRLRGPSKCLIFPSSSPRGEMTMKNDESQPKAEAPYASRSPRPCAG